MGNAAGAATLPRYHAAQRLIHWVVAVLAVITLAMGLTLGSLGVEGARALFGVTATNLLYTSHKTCGVLMLGLMVLRVVFRVTLGKPGYAHPLPMFQRVASEVVHGALYLLLLAMPVLGWLATAAGDFPVAFFHYELPRLIGTNEALSEQLYAWHGAVGLTVLGLIVLHVAAALYHWRIRRDGVMQRMSLFRPK
ncbi:cytochrome b [Aquisalimonas lutea]|uniref:cytochrome b n=1 Tax=Aquisalimonas lutea TaxID=1327750 RepID=UPI0025B3AD4D|nr:cytochrome b [Aquisalimonas lutea]MDN3517038.1 cytochrome b [Aquisalimonas lutea]